MSRAETLRHVRYVATQNPVTLFAFIGFATLLVLALIGPWIVPFDPLASETQSALQGPSARHWFGTDALGRDIFSRIVVATQLDLGIALSAVITSFIAGAAAAILVFSPIMLLIALAIKLSSRGPVLFTQMRGGRGGVPFRVYKFRTTSRISASQLVGSLVQLQQLTGGVLRGLPLQLVVRPIRVTPDGKV